MALNQCARVSLLPGSSLARDPIAIRVRGNMLPEHEAQPNRMVQDATHAVTLQRLHAEWTPRHQGYTTAWSAFRP
jgi:hypothetical protein